MEKKRSKSQKWALVDPSTSDLAMSMSSRESVTSQLSTPTVPHEESVLEMYFSLLSQTHFDKAKDLVDTEKDGHKFSVVPNWGEMLQCLSQLAVAERSYANLVFLGHKRVIHIVRTKDSTRSLYSLLLQEFLRMDNAPAAPGSTSATPPREGIFVCGVDETEKLLAHICGQLHLFICARLKAMDFYEQLATLGSTRHWLNFEDLLMMCKEVLADHDKDFHHPLLVPLRQSFSLEVESLCHLLHAQIHMCQWSYLPSVLQLQQAHTKLLTWSENIPMKETKSTFGRSSIKACPYPPLLNWLLKFKGVLLSKFGLYFHDILAKQTVANELKMNHWKLQDDFYGRIQAFHKKQDACCIYLILDAHDLHPRAGEGGYLYPGKYAPSLQGLRTYPPIFSYPLERVVNPAHWPNICMLISSQSETKYFYEKATDKRPHSSYFLSRLDSRVWLMLVFEAKRGEKDSSINTFLTEITSQLRCQAIISSLKSFAKS